jgi:HlyD family secretion protein
MKSKEPGNPPQSMPFPRKDGTARRRRRWPFVAAALLLAAIVAGLWPKPVAVEIAEASYGPLQMAVSDEGQTRVKNRYVVSAPVAGHMRRVPWKAGAEVEARVTPLTYLETGGADLLDARSLAQAQARVSAVEASRRQAMALEARARAGAELAKAERVRAEQLFERGGLSKQELDQAVMRDTAAAEDVRAAVFALQVAQHEEEQARALLLRGQPDAQTAGEPLLITSPVTGRILRVFQESERQVPAGFAILEVGDITDLEVRVEVLSRDGVAIRPGATVWLDQWGGVEPLRARVRWVEPSAFTKISALGVEEQRVYVIADLVDPLEKRPTLGDAYRVEARVVLWESEHALRVPAGALFQKGGEWKAYAVDGRRARLRNVTVGHSDGRMTEVLDGLREHDRVIVYPGDRIADGVRVAELPQDKSR